MSLLSTSVPSMSNRIALICICGLSDLKFIRLCRKQDCVPPAHGTASGRHDAQLGVKAAALVSLAWGAGGLAKLGESQLARSAEVPNRALGARARQACLSAGLRPPTCLRQTETVHDTRRRKTLASKS